MQASASFSPRVYSGVGVRLIEDGEYRPAGGRASRTEAVRTPGVPEAPEALRTIHVYPQGYEGVQRSPAHTRLDVALAGAQPGDLIFVYNGHHPGGVTLRTSGTEEAPIVIR